MIPIRYNLRSLAVRRGTSLMTVAGVALVVMILFILLGFIEGLRATMANAAERGNWIVLSRSVTTESSSYVSREQYEIIRARREIAADPKGEPLVSPEIVAAFNPTPDGPLAQSSFTYLRGVYPIAFKVHRGVRIVSGRTARAGEPELLVGVRLAARFPQLAPGRHLRFAGRDWTIVGTFSDDGSTREGEVWTDLDLVAQDLQMQGAFSSLHLVMKPAMGSSFEAALTRDARLRLDAETERAFYDAQSLLADQLRMLGIAIALVLAIGAIFGGMNTMYTAVARRTREVGVLRALGFRRRDILASFMVESTLLGLAGGIAGELLGVAVAYATGLESRIMSVATFIFSFRLAPSAFVSGLVAAIMIGALGGVLPAWRATRMGVNDSLRTA
jgi:putative ABC transport system permease protein